jgi:hypothetical protein
MRALGGMTDIPENEGIWLAVFLPAPEAFVR